MGFPNDKCQRLQEQNVMKDVDWGGFRTLICAWKGKAQYPIQLLYLSTALQLNCFFYLAVKRMSMQILHCQKNGVWSFFSPSPLD